jgi:hypothetical protein
MSTFRRKHAQCGATVVINHDGVQPLLGQRRAWRGHRPWGSKSASCGPKPPQLPSTPRAGDHQVDGRTECGYRVVARLTGDRSAPREGANRQAAEETKGP